MKKLLLTLSILASANAFAVHNGNVDGNILGNQTGDTFHAVNPSDYPSIVEDGGTGMMVAGRFVISAGHVVNLGYGTDWHSFGSQEFYQLQNSEHPTDLHAYSNYGEYDAFVGYEERVKYINYQITPKEEDPRKQLDFSITHTKNQIKASEIIFIADLTDASNIPMGNEEIYSFGSHCGKASSEGEDCNRNLTDRRGFAFSTRTVDNTPGMSNKIKLYSNPNPSYMVDGDSGGPVLSNKQELIAVNVTGGVSDQSSDGYSLLYAYSEIILKTINRWHYPTVAYMKAGKQKTITIQSLHVLDESLTTSTITASDNVNVIDTTCDAGNGIKPYGKCYITFESTDGKVGKVILGDDDQYIDINPKAMPAIIDLRKKDATKELPKAITQPSESSDGGGSSGAGIGIYSLLALLSLALARVKKITLL